jgi:hypothetical protein
MLIEKHFYKIQNCIYFLRQDFLAYFVIKHSTFNIFTSHLLLIGICSSTTNYSFLVFLPDINSIPNNTGQWKIFKTTGLLKMATQIWNTEDNSFPVSYTMIYEEESFTAPNV